MRSVSAALDAAVESLPQADPTELLHRVVYAWSWLTTEEQAAIAGTIAHITHPRRTERPASTAASWAA